MNKFFPIVLIAISACNHDTQNISNNENKIDEHTRAKDTIDKTKFYTTQDTIFVTTENKDTLKYIRKDFNEIVDNFPALYSDRPVNPDLTFHCIQKYKDFTDEEGNKKHISFSGETGQDEFYVLYAYFLRKQFSLDKYETNNKR